MSRKRKIVVFILILLIVAWLLSYCVPVHGFWSTGRIIYQVDYDDTYGCMWEWGVAIVFDNVRYMLATDACGTIFVGNWGLIDISTEERAVLEAMFTSRGATFP